VLAGANAISLHLPASPDTDALIGARELALMPAGSVLINTGRASVVERGALLEALRTHHWPGRGSTFATGNRSTHPIPCSRTLTWYAHRT
jgi:phosphoglycerate dehydrogenase-like enzyme